MILQPISGILMSKHLYTFIEIPGISALIRQIHMVLAYWGFVLMSMHAGTHLMPMIRKIQKAAFPVKAATLACIAAISLYRAYVFVKRQIPEYMFMRTMFVFFDFGENRIRFLADYLAVMALFAMLGLITTVVLSFSKEKKEKGDIIEITGGGIPLLRYMGFLKTEYHSSETSPYGCENASRLNHTQ
ncbi:MAG: DUF4405 domain-containing protein [Eubacterium sp.]|nr:DUF4405 domain-containing protein [Eubacterium sp.]